MRRTLSLAVIATAIALSSLPQPAQAEQFFNDVTGQWVGSPDISPNFIDWNKRWREQEKIRSTCYDRWRTDEAIRRCIDRGGRY